MTAQSVAFDNALSGLHRLGLPDRLPSLHAIGLRISRQALGGSHSVAVYPPINSLSPVDPAMVARAIDTGRETSLYLHIPFCETRCTFCHYAVRHYPGKGQGSGTGDSEVERYLFALKQEMAIWGARLARAGTRISSIYIGGGTPLVLQESALGDMLAALRCSFDVVAGSELCIEGSPLSITAPGGEDKLRFLKAHGVTRLSFGVQSFDDAVLRYAARGYKRDVAIRATQIVAAVFDNWNLDLIQGLYKGSPFETWESLQVIADIRPPHLTWYHGRFADRPQRDWFRTEAKYADFEDKPATLLGRMLIWQELASLGYHQTDGNRFVRERRHVDPFKTIRTTASSNLIGLGNSAYSHVCGNGEARSSNAFGYLFRNEVNIRSYVDRVAAGAMPIATGRVIDDAELFATSYATGLRHGRVEGAALAAIRAREPSLTADYDRLAQSLVEIGILDVRHDDRNRRVLRLSDLGRLFEDETLALFFSPAVNETLRQRAIAPPGMHAGGMAAAA